MKILTALMLAGLMSPPPASAEPALNEGSTCMPGFCPAPSHRGPPPGLMYLSIGLIGAGLSGLWPRKIRGDSRS
jgi:hypothetical protein